MMINFLRSHISAKIILGYVATILLMLAFAFFAIRVQNQIVNAVDELIQNLEAEKTLSQNIVADMALARSYANAYVKEPVQSNLDAFIIHVTDLNKLLEEEDNLATNPARKQIIGQISAEVRQYGLIFGEIARLIQENQTIEARLTIYELDLDNHMSALRVHINVNDDTSFSILYGNMRTAYLSMRLNVIRYISQEDERYNVLVNRDYKETRAGLTDLRDMLNDPVQIRNVDEAEDALENYYNDYLVIQKNQNEMRRLFRDGLDVLEPGITRAVDDLADSIEQDFAERNITVRQWAWQMQLYVIGTAVFLLIFSLAFGIFFSYNITRPLQQVMSLSQQVANKDLAMLASQMSTLSHGDVNLQLDISAQPMVVEQHDEVGQMAHAFNEIIFRLQDIRLAFEQMAAYLNEMTDAARDVAQGNLNVDIKVHSERDVLATALIDMVANLRSVQDQLLRQLARLATLHEVDGMITTNQNLQGILSFIMNQALEHLDVAAAELYLIDTESGKPGLKVHAGPNLDELPEEYCLSVNEHLNKVIEDQKYYSFDLTDEVYEGCNFPFKSLYIVPLMIGTNVIGVLQVFSYLPLAPDGDRDTFLETLAGQAAIAINNHDLLRGLEGRVSQRTRELQSSQRYFQSLVDHSPVAIIVMDLNDSITGWNPAAEKLFGYPAQEAIGKNLDDLIAGEVYHDEAIALSRQVDESFVHVFTQRYRKDGSLMAVEIFGEPIFVEGERLGTLAIYHDITDLQRARQDAEEATRIKSEFLANMSHEIRTPMNGVIGMTSLLLDTPLTGLQRDYVETIRISSESLLAIVNDILDFSKIEAGRMELEFHSFNLRDCMESALDLIAHQASVKQLELAYLMKSQVPETVMGDETRLRQIITNLLSNAVKFTDEGEITLSIWKDEKTDIKLQKGDHALHFCVTDSGVGISPDRIGRLFQSFSQVDASTTRKYGGTGLGLAISKKLCEMMGGKIWVDSEGQGKGSSFHVLLPFKETIGTPQHDQKTILNAVLNKRLYIVDDNATNRDVLMHFALNLQMNPVAFVSGAEMLNALEKEELADLAILDIQMPEMDGITLAQEIRKHYNAVQLPIIFLTSLGRKEHIPDDIHPRAYLQKPIKFFQFYEALGMVFLEQPAQVEQMTTATSFDVTMGKRHPLRILLAEDHVVNQRVALLTLEKLGYRADVVSNGVEVLQAFERQYYDVVLMDVQMPEMDGVSATRNLRLKLPKKRQPYIIALTANVLSGDRERYLEAGMDDYLSKPMHVADLIKTLEKCKPTKSKREEIVSTMPEHKENDTASINKTAEKSIQTPLEADDKKSLAVDFKVLNDYFPGFEKDISFLEGVVNLYLEDTPRRLENLRQMIVDRNIELTRTTSHALKGASLNFGATRLAELLKVIEMKARSGTLDGMDEIYKEVQKEYQRVENDLRKIINR
ncbi:MAG: response regulator [Anaerolineae bacterium]|nr:response regulator [Anaerolineae bacterium]